jgi:hypothetical protein
MEARFIAAEKKYAHRKRFLTLLLVSLLIFTSTLEVSAASIKLAWDPSTEPLVTGYRLYYGKSSGVYTNVVDAGNRMDYTASELDAGATYYFVATAYTGTGDESTFSNETSYTIPGSSPTPSGDSASGSGGGCFIATAAYGSGLAPEVTVLREFRDRYLLTNRWGQAFVDWYYAVSPPLADFIAEHESLRTASRLGLTPVVYAVKYPAAALAVTLLLPAGIIVRKRLKATG